MSEIERLNMIAEWQEQHKQLIEDLDNSKKRIAELEHQLTHRNCLDCSNHSSNLRMRNLELEKENAELKEQCSILADCNTCISACKTENIEMKNNLTKAKEIIKKFSEFVNNENEYDPERPQEYTDLWNKLCEETEQFLKDIKEG